MEADLQEQGLWLGDLWTGLLSVRRVAVIASQLPLGARVYGAGDSDAMWSTADYWAAGVVDAIQENTWVTANYGVKSSDQSPRPKPVKRPEDLRKEKADQARMEANARMMREAYAQYTSEE